MDRRSFLVTPAVVATAKGCGDSMSGGQPPWHLWGSTKRLEVPIAAGPFPIPAASDQLARVNYGRPETWSFLFVAEVIACTPVIAGGPFDLTVAFNVATGIGLSRFVSEDQRRVSLSVFNHDSFARLRFAFAPGEAVLGKKKWTTVGETPVIDDLSAVVPPPRERIEFLAAQDIQCGAIANGSAFGVAPTNVAVNVSAFFAPLNHVRPDWFAENAEQFAQGELGGH